jgi:hypothetical protein
VIGDSRQTDAKSTLRQIAEPFRPVVTLAIVNLLRDRCQGLVFRAGSTVVRAGVAQLVEHLICNQTVGGSSPFASSRVSFRWLGIPPQSFHTDGIFPLGWLRGKASAEWGRVVYLRLRGDFFCSDREHFARSAIVHRWPSG